MKEIDLKKVYKTILDVSYKHNLSHLSSCLNSAPVIKEIYDKKRPQDLFVLSSGHAGLALYSVLQEIGSKSAESRFLHHGIHPDRCNDCNLDCSTGSLGQGLPIALGMALASPDKDIYCVISDGEAMEGSIWESLRIKNEQGAANLKVYAILNEYSAYRRSPRVPLANKLSSFDPLINIKFIDNPPLGWLQGVNGHYATMDQTRYREALKCLTK